MQIYVSRLCEEHINDHCDFFKGTLGSTEIAIEIVYSIVYARDT